MERTIDVTRPASPHDFHGSSVLIGMGAGASFAVGAWACSAATAPILLGAAGALCLGMRYSIMAINTKALSAHASSHANVRRVVQLGFAVFVVAMGVMAGFGLYSARAACSQLLSVQSSAWASVHHLAVGLFALKYSSLALSSLFTSGIRGLAVAQTDEGRRSLIKRALLSLTHKPLLSLVTHLQYPADIYAKGCLLLSRGQNDQEHALDLYCDFMINKNNLTVRESASHLFSRLHGFREAALMKLLCILEEKAQSENDLCEIDNCLSLCDELYNNIYIHKLQSDNELQNNNKKERIDALVDKFIQKKQALSATVEIGSVERTLLSPRPLSYSDRALFLLCIPALIIYFQRTPIGAGIGCIFGLLQPPSNELFDQIHQINTRGSFCEKIYSVALLATAPALFDHRWLTPLFISAYVASCVRALRARKPHV